MHYAIILQIPLLRRPGRSAGRLGSLPAGNGQHDWAGTEPEKVGMHGPQGVLKSLEFDWTKFKALKSWNFIK